MATLNVKVTSRNMIKPSSPTPTHLKLLQISLLDQFVTTMHMPLVFYYKNSDSHATDYPSERSTLLKRSLSNTLVRFYPLAGRIQAGNNSIDCNDQGVEYYEARVSGKLSEVTENPPLEELIKLLPCSPISTVNKSIVTCVQVNNFSCGGMAIGVCISHKIADASTSVAFINAWARNTRGVISKANHVAPVQFDWTSMFPPRDCNAFYNPEARICQQKMVTRRLIVDKKTIAALKEKATSYESQGMKNPTRVEVVSAFICKHFIEADNAKLFSTAANAVNLTNRMEFPIPEDHGFGNLVWFVLTDTSSSEGVRFMELLSKLSEALKQVDGNEVQKLQTGESPLELKKRFENFIERSVELFVYRSCTMFPLYEADFGWGKQVCVSTTPTPVLNKLLLLTTKCGERIEVWINFLEEDTSLFEQHLRVSINSMARARM